MPPVDQKDECYRCGYDLRGINDDQPCPECGLLAERSRRTSDELHFTRPHWLRNLARGVWMILLSFLAAATTPFLTIFFNSRVITEWVLSFPQSWWNVLFIFASHLALFVGSIGFVIGVMFLTTREGYASSDRQDRSRRILLRALSSLPLIGLLFIDLFEVYFDWRITSSSGQRSRNIEFLFQIRQYSEQFAIPVLIFFLLPTPVLLFNQLRSLARRARNPHLAEHCTIVGIGTGIAMFYVLMVLMITTYAKQIGLDLHWADRSKSWLVLMSIAGTFATLFFFWSLYLLVRFAIAFHLAARKLRKTWARDDRSADASV